MFQDTNAVKNVTDAMETCQSLHPLAALVDIESQQERLFLSSLLANNPGNTANTMFLFSLSTNPGATLVIVVHAGPCILGNNPGNPYYGYNVLFQSNDYEPR